MECALQNYFPDKKKNAYPPLHEVQVCGEYVYKKVRMVMAASATRMLMKMCVAALKNHEIFNAKASVQVHRVHNHAFVRSHL